MDAEKLILIAAKAVKAATGEDVHTVQTFHEFADGRISYFIMTKPGRSFRVMLVPNSQQGQLSEGMVSTSFFDYTDEDKINFRTVG